MQKIVLTGGSSGGRTTAMTELRKIFLKKVAFIPEVATIIFSSGSFAYQEMPIEEKWQFQKAVLLLQESIEETFDVLSTDISVALCERGLLDGSAYVPGGVDAFCEHFNLTKQEIFSRYLAVFHFESVATGAPHLYDRTANNLFRYETLKEAQENEYISREIWIGHPNYHFVSCSGGVEGKINCIKEFVEKLLL